MSMVLLANCTCDDNPTKPTDNTRPTVVAVNPVDQDTGIALDRYISVRFSELIKETSVTASSFLISPAIVGTIVFDSSEVAFAPEDSLDYETTYQVTLTTDITDLSGNALAEDYTWSFTTVADPATTLPEVLATFPTANATRVDPAGTISATFSKLMDTATLTTSNFTLSPAISGSVSNAAITATFTPDDTLAFNTVYTATITTAVADTFGNYLASDYVWNFTTGDDPMIPVAYILEPAYDAIVGDTTNILVSTSHPVGVTRVQFFVDNIYQSGFDDTSEPFEYEWVAASWEIGSTHQFSAIAYDADGRVGYSDTISIYYQWEEIATDPNDDQRADIFRIFARSSDSLLEFRYEYWENWENPWADTAFDLGIFLDTDLSSQTGMTQLSDGSFLNGIGAEYRIIVGGHALDCFSEIAVNNTDWIVLSDTSGLSYYNVPPDTNIFEIGVRWEDLGDPVAVNMVCNNVFFITSSTILRDWVPNNGNGYLSIQNASRYVGEGYQISTSIRPGPQHKVATSRPNPFD